MFVTAALENLLGSIARYPLPYLTMPFNIVQQLLFLILISVSTASVTPAVNVTQVTPHVTSGSLARMENSVMPSPQKSINKEDENYTHYNLLTFTEGSGDTRMERSTDESFLNKSGGNTEEVHWSGVSLIGHTEHCF